MLKRDLSAMASEHYDLLIIGGGISGCCVAHDAALRGLKVALVEMKDFGWATSAATSKLIHGGLRYLKNLEFGLVRESLRERRTLTAIAPHMVFPLPFLVPTYKESSNSKFLIFPGMALYDILSYDKARLDDPDRQLPHFDLLSKDEVLVKEPTTNPENLTGGATYYDCQMYSAERLTLSFLISAAKNGARVANYAKVTELLIENDGVLGARVEDRFTGQAHDIHATITVNVCGPWADFISGMLKGHKPKKIVRSEGIHIIVKKMINEHALVYRTSSGRHFFMIPWRGKTLIGTTDKRFEGSPDDYFVRKSSVEEFLGEINESHPAANLTCDDVEAAYGGMRPIVEEETDVEVDVYDKSRRYEIYDHETDDKIRNFLTVIGGKYTTSRSLAENLVDTVYKKMGEKPKPCVTTTVPVEGGNIRIWDHFTHEAKLRYRDIPDEILHHILHSYGSSYEWIMGLIEDDPSLAEPLSKDSQNVKACIPYAVKYEMAQTLEDVIMRRTDQFLVGSMTRNEVKMAAEQMGKLLGWDEERILKETDTVVEILASRNIRDV